MRALTLPHQLWSSGRVPATGALSGALCGLLAALPAVALDWWMIVYLAEAALPDLTTHLFVLMMLAALLLWPAAALGSLGGLALALLDEGARRWWRWRLAWLTFVGGCVCVGALTLRPALMDTPEARQALQLALWLGGWMALMWLTRPRRRRDVAKPRLTRRARAALTRRAPGSAYDDEVAWWSSPGWLVRVAGGMAAGLLAVTVWVVLGWSGTPTERSLVLEHGALAGALASGAQGAVDLDGDGVSPWFGGGDCDDRNPEVHPGAVERALNGVDEDCDGEDGTLEVPMAEARRAVDLGFQAAHREARRLQEAAPPAPELPTPSPIILVTVDTLRADALGIYGATPSPTPTLDAMADEVVVFERAYAQAPLTKASLSSMMTGKYYHDVARNNRKQTTILADNEMLAELLGEEGYATAAITTHRYLGERYGWAQGFDHFECLGQGAGRGRRWWADLAVDRAVDRIASLEADGGPWFLWLHIIDPHHPYEIHESIAAEGITEALTLGGSRRERYNAELAWTDRQLKRLLEALRANGLWDKALFVLHADHGESFGDHGYNYHGQGLYEEQLRVPLLVRAPGVEVARRVSAPTMLFDVFPTLLAWARQTPLAEQGPPADLSQGRPVSLWPVLLGQWEGDSQRALFAERVPVRRPRRVRKGVTVGRWKLMHAPAEGIWRLFDLREDPRELSDVSAREPERLEEMKTTLRRFMRRR